MAVNGHEGAFRRHTSSVGSYRIADDGVGAPKDRDESPVNGQAIRVCRWTAKSGCPVVPRHCCSAAVTCGGLSRQVNESSGLRAPVLPRVPIPLHV